MNNKFHFSKTRAIELQDTAQTVPEADMRFEMSCSICPKAGYCDENKCYVAQTHHLRVEQISFALTLSKKKLQPSCEIVHTRKYTKTNKFNKGTLQRLLSIANNKVDLEKQKLAIDQASVYVEIDDYKNAYEVLKQNGVYKEAEAILKYYRGNKE